jgi:hypothetical protein
MESGLWRLLDLFMRLILAEWDSSPNLFVRRLFNDFFYEICLMNYWADCTYTHPRPGVVPLYNWAAANCVWTYGSLASGQWSAAGTASPCMLFLQLSPDFSRRVFLLASAVLFTWMWSDRSSTDRELIESMLMWSHKAKPYYCNAIMQAYSNKLPLSEVPAGHPHKSYTAMHGPQLDLGIRLLGSTPSVLKNKVVLDSDTVSKV